jgi:hypothetical protein
MCPAFSPPLPPSSTSLDTEYLKPIPKKTNTVMKTTLYSILAAAAACGMAFGETAYTTPVGYYNFDAKAGGNIFVPGLVNSSAFAGVVTAVGANTLTVAPGAITANAFDEGSSYATHYVEITQSGSNQGVVIDIVSNTNSVITLASDISALSMTGTETITIRPHVTLSGAFASAESVLAAYGDSATFANPDGTSTTYYFIGGVDWSTDFSTPDGNDRPISPGTGIVFDCGADAALTIAGEVKSTDTVVQIAGNGVPNVVGPVNPLVGGSALIKDLGFADMVAYGDSISIYAPGQLFAPTGTYYALGDGDVSTDFSTPSSDTFDFTKGAIFIAGSDTAFRVKSGL